MFSIFGLITSGIGIFGSQSLVAKSLGINMNLWWGIFMLAFGLFMLFMAWRKAK